MTKPDRLTPEERRALAEYRGPVHRVVTRRPPEPPTPDPVTWGPGPRHTPRPRTPERLALPVRELLEWAFAAEGARLELPPRLEAEDIGFGFGLEWVMIQQARLGVRIDRSRGGSDPHEDAEVVAAVVGGLPEHLGGRRMAVQVAELARARLTPDPMVGAVPRLVPLEWHQNRHGRRGRSQVFGVEVELRRDRLGRVERREVELRWVPCRWHPEARTIEAARRDWARWRRALAHISRSLRVSRVLRRHRCLPGLPPAEPWTRG